MANDGKANKAEELNGESKENVADAEPEASTDESGQGESDELSVAELSEALAAAQAEIEGYKDKVLRVSAEMDNMRRRAAIDLENAHKFGLEKIASELLPVKDSLELGLAASSAENVELAKVVERIDLTLKMMGSMMEKFGIKEVDPINQKFNPDHHQAMTMQETVDAEPNTVINVFQKGYLLNERLIRPAMVVVAKGPSGGNGSDSTKIDEMA